MTEPSSKRFALALALSVAVHGAVVTLWTSEPRAPQAGGHTMTIALVVHADKTVKSPAPEITTAAKPKPESTKEKTRATSKFVEKIPSIAEKKVEIAMTPVPVNAPNDAVADQPVAVQQPSYDNGQSKQSHATTETTNIILKSVLRKAFNAHFYYPRLAIRRGWQGEVRLGLRIESNGNLTQIRILQGSGYGLLDKAAMKSLNKVEVLPDAIALLNGQSLDLILPVKYQLL